MLSRLSINATRRLVLMTNVSSQKITKSKFSRLACNITNNCLKKRSAFETLTCSRFSAIIPVRHQSTINVKLAENVTSTPPAPAEQPIQNAVESTSTVVNASTVESTNAVTGKGFISEIPDLPPIPVPSVHPNGEATLESIGLGGYSPIGLVQKGLEAMHIYLDMPWWEAIVIGTLCIRIVLFPLVIQIQKSVAHTQAHLPGMQKHQLRMTEARQSGDAFEAAKAANDLTKYLRKNKVNPLKTFGLSLAQFPVFISCFLGLRRMAVAPVESMKEGGLLWFPDLTVSDPYYLLPVITSLSLYISMEFSIMTSDSLGNQGLVKYFMRAAPIITLPIILNFPTAILCYWTTTNVITSFQIAALKVPALRNYFGIPRHVVHAPETLPIKEKGFREGLNNSWTNWQISRKLAEKQRADMVQFNQAGKGPIKKTFRTDPTKEPPTAERILARKI
ncbi:OXA1L mitochondrial inner membrane protein [Lasioglossum baleicum]|uniref:OXA1L mitochondrial inner membrane protein n=1 Tax=Lasioglossum baleicum TaxID=434251 RepID=UPI003FCEA088